MLVILKRVQNLSIIIHLEKLCLRNFFSKCFIGQWCDNVDNSYSEPTLDKISKQLANVSPSILYYCFEAVTRIRECTEAMPAGDFKTCTTFLDHTIITKTLLKDFVSKWFTGQWYGNAHNL